VRDSQTYNFFMNKEELQSLANGLTAWRKFIILSRFTCLTFYNNNFIITKVN
jgi:hypothetical protein